MKNTIYENKTNSGPRDEQVKFIYESLDDLPTAERTILYLHYWQNYSIEDISFICDLSQSLVKNILAEAIHRLRLNYLIEFSVPRNSENHAEASLMEETCSA